MDMFDDNRETLVQYTKDNELFGIFRINALKRFSSTLSGKELDGWNKILLNVMIDYNLSGQYDENIVPEKWIRACLDHLNSLPKDAHIINTYASDVMWLALVNHNIHKTWNTLFDEVNSVVLKCPPTNSSFIVFRGVNIDTFHSIGDRIFFDTPKSASFGTISCDKHIGDHGCILIINVPKGKHLAYHESEDQVIFPIGSELEIINIIPARKLSIGIYKSYECILH